jgi:hypothetical protein
MVRYRYDDVNKAGDTHFGKKLKDAIENSRFSEYTTKRNKFRGSLRNQGRFVPLLQRKYKSARFPVLATLTIIANHYEKLIRREFGSTPRKLCLYLRKFVKSNKLSNPDGIKLFAVLLGIYYAEFRQDQRGTLANYFLETQTKTKKKILAVGGPSSFSPLQVPVGRLEEIYPDNSQLRRALFNIQDKYFGADRAILEAINIVYFHIGIKRRPEIIFTTYNHAKFLVAERAALQIFLNLLRQYALHILASVRNGRILDLPGEVSMDIALTEKSNVNNDIFNFEHSLAEKDKAKMQDIAQKLHLSRIRKVIFLKKSGKISKEMDKLGRLKGLEIKRMKKLLANWPVQTIDGDPQRGFTKAVKAATEFFQIDGEFTFQRGTTVQMVDQQIKKLARDFGIAGIEAVPTHLSSGWSNTKRDKIFEEVLQLAEYDVKVIGRILKKHKVPGVREGKELEILRRFICQNKGNWYRYVDDGMDVYRSVMQQFGYDKL